MGDTDSSKKINHKMIDEFTKLKNHIRLEFDTSKTKQDKLKHSFRLKALEKVLKIIASIKYEITSSEQLKDMKDIGKNTLERIDEILKYGRLDEIKDSGINDQKYLKYIDKLMDIHGIGEKTALILYKEHKVKSVEDLKQIYESGKIVLPESVIKGLKYYGVAKEAIPRENITEINEYFQKKLKEIDDKLSGTICGSYRRMKQTSGDIDMLITHSKSKKSHLSIFIETLKNDGFIIDSLTSEDVTTKYMGYCQYKNEIYRIDIRYVPYESYPTALLYFTGSKDFNTNMRRLAIALGYMLNEYHLLDENNKPMKVTSEQDVFDILGMEYVTPDKR